MLRGRNRAAVAVAVVSPYRGSIKRKHGAESAAGITIASELIADADAHANTVQGPWCLDASPLHLQAKDNTKLKHL